MKRNVRVQKRKEKKRKLARAQHIMKSFKDFLRNMVLCPNLCFEAQSVQKYKKDFFPCQHKVFDMSNLILSFQ